ncbi:uncharacterized protein LACBIDRAFT_298241 [Laccaria bicolor S238N-H82]|uniref:Predicted protein n=1 Tax=Laccaria bicolor (strain S238N-H82 / ATCC MYA-4686) TaxID=486041 RepID=B0DCJ4_LACBS|nr:uncharacterized protein LACBIDRAFT_298241 [Laccaria bicolor S238N-H82]EDR07739.1 predicted protein [Laccaria bicolor S238N-H82]|eukprot:XP_001881528.1 predicted protein [Laccaria bicolor S238N-H82]
MKIENWVKEWCHSLPTRMHATISGDSGTLIVSNLIDGVDTYVIPPQELLRSFRHPINSNVPLLVSSVMDSSLIVVGSDDGCLRIYDHHTGHLSMSLPHRKGLVQIVDAISDNRKSIIVTGTSDTHDIAIKIWAPIKEIAEDAQNTPPPPVYSAGLSFWQIVCIILVCCSVQAILLNLPFDRISDLIQNCLKLRPHFHH